MSSRREIACFSVVLACLVAGLLRESILGGKVLSPADVLLVEESFRDVPGASDEPLNRLLMDPVLQFQPWIEFNRSEFRQGRLPLWNPFAGCGAPHLANGQSAPFDPFHLIAYFGTLPEAHAWIAGARLWVAGLGMFLLARRWGLGPWGRWFAGLTFPLSGFVIVWLLFPVTSVAIWLPWLLLTADRLLERPSARRIGLHAITTGLCLLGGHIQTAAHVMLASGAFVAWTVAGRFRQGDSLRRPSKLIGGWALATVIGIGIGSVTVIPLGSYLTRSPVWGDRRNEAMPAWWIAPPRWLDAFRTGVPTLYGSQRRGHPNLAPAIGADNFNEAAGGFAGLATLVWLAPSAWASRRSSRHVEFLWGLTAVGFLGAFDVPPVANLGRALPVLDVMDHRRLTLWVAFGLVMLGGIGIDGLRKGNRHWPPSAWLAVLLIAGGASMGGAQAVRFSEPWLRSRAVAHYENALKTEPGANPALYRARAERQVRYALTTVPRALNLAGLELLILGAMGTALRRGWASPRAVGAAAFGATLLELFMFADGMNPAISRRLDRPETAVVRRLREMLGPGERLIGLGQEFPPNTAMRYGLSDARNYDSVELSRSIGWFEPLYQKDHRAVSSRSTVRWGGVGRAIDRLKESGVAAIVSEEAPPLAFDGTSEQVGYAWITRIDGRPLVTVEPSDAGTAELVSTRPGRIEARVIVDRPAVVVVRETFDPGWKAMVDGQVTAASPRANSFIHVYVEEGAHDVLLEYDPLEVRWAVAISVVSLMTAMGLTAFKQRSGPVFQPGALVRRNPSG